jgi:hypothetical protein
MTSFAIRLPYDSMNSYYLKITLSDTSERVFPFLREINDRNFDFMQLKTKSISYTERNSKIGNQARKRTEAEKFLPLLLSYEPKPYTIDEFWGFHAVQVAEIYEKDH